MKVYLLSFCEHLVHLSGRMDDDLAVMLHWPTFVITTTSSFNDGKMAGVDSPCPELLSDEERGYCLRTVSRVDRYA